jgi:hypothetical protein
MTDFLLFFGTLVALILPWLLGYAFLAGLLKTSPQWNRQIILGHGYLVGLFLTTLIIRIWDMVGLPLHFWSIAALLALLATAIFLGTRNRGEVPKQARTRAPEQNWQRLIVWLLVTLIIYRYYGLASELWLKPLYPWDAWMNWAPKAVVWFNLQELATFISPQEWLASPENELSYTAGARNAWKYPVTVPLIQLWGMLAAGASDQTYSNLPWLLAPLAFSLALYGHLRNVGASALLAVTACYILLSIPYLNVHSTLAGYADLWLALAFGAAIMALSEWQVARHWSWGVLTLLFAVVCTQLKLPGVVLGGIILAVFVVSMINPGRKVALIAAFLIVPLLLFVVFNGLSLDIPSIGLVEISSTRIAVPYIGAFDLAYYPVHDALASTLFSLSNWNIFWYLFVAIITVKILRLELLMPPSLALQSIALTVLFLGFVFYFTHIHQFVLDFTTVNRAILYLVPGTVFYIFNTFYQWNTTDKSSTGAYSVHSNKASQGS